jgi:hypothetical protein
MVPCGGVRFIWEVADHQSLGSFFSDDDDKQGGGVFPGKNASRFEAILQTFPEDAYNVKRLHSSLDYVPPDEFELKYSMF